MLPFPRRFRLQYASNLFAYADPRKAERLLTPAAPYLALLGNVFSIHSTSKRYNSREFLSYCADNWKRTLIIPATTEMGSWVGPKTGSKALYTDLLEELKNVVSEINTNASGRLHILEMNEHTFPFEGVRVLGLTGWSAWARQANPDPESGLPSVYTYTSDGHTKRMAPSDAHQLSAEEMEWLGAELTAKPRTPTILLSHGLSSSLFLNNGLDPMTYKMPDLMNFYPYGAMYGGRTPLVRACLGGAYGITATRTFGNRFHGVNGWKSYPTQEVPNPNYNPECVYEYAWYDDEDSGGGLIAYDNWMSLVRKRTRNHAPAICE